MNVLVTGGAGFIGANFLNRSLARFPERRFINVDCLTYAANPGSVTVQDPARYVLERVDIADVAAVDRVFAEHRPQLVVHFAAETHVDRSILGPAAFIRTNVQGTHNLLESFKRHCAAIEGACFHHVSTDEVYGSLTETGRFHESLPFNPSSPYAASKAASDLLVNAYHRTYGLPTKITNGTNTYGPYQFPEKLIPLVLLNALEGKQIPVYGEGLNVRDWLYVNDHCDAIWAVIERGDVGQTYSVGGNAERRNIDVVEALCAILAEETGRRESDFTKLITFVKDRPGHDFRCAVDMRKLRENCGFEPAETFDSGLRSTVRWYLDNAAWTSNARSDEYRRWIERNYGAREELLRGPG